MRLPPAVLCCALLLAAAHAHAADTQDDKLKDCMDKQQASNTTGLTQEQMLKACQDHLAAVKQAQPAAMSKATAKRAGTGGGQPIKQGQQR